MALFSQNRWLKITVRLALFFRASGSLVSEFTGTPQFVCLEPWQGLTDAENTDHNWDNKVGLSDLAAGKEFSSEQNIWVE